MSGSDEPTLPLTTPPPSRTYHPLTAELDPPSKRMSILDLTVEIPSSTRVHSSLTDAKRPVRWKTLEFKLYYALAVIMLPIMAWIPISISRASHPNFPFFKSRLSEGWIWGRQIDNSDAQYRSFRNNIPILSLVSGLFVALKYIWTLSYPTRTSIPNNLHLIPFNLIFSVIFISVLHGTSTLKIFIILSLNYTIAKSSKDSRFGPLLTWVFNAAVLYVNDRYSGYRFGHMNSSLEFLDAYQGVYPRWHVSFNITMLRLVSFNMDYYWASKPHPPPETGTNLTEKQRQTIPHPEEMYSFANFVCYTLYSPLYIAGPIMTFNDFLWQHRRPLNITRPSVLRYLVRLLFSLLTMEFILHFMYVVAIKDTKAWMGDTPAQISMIGFWNLMIVWLKLLIPWRFFRLWALMGGIDPPENMIRCMVNNYSTLGFWRSWHRSYNLWIIRYIYIPLGGARSVFLNSLLVFSFVALWHDLTFKLFAWGWLVTFFILPELLARYVLPQSKFGSLPWYRHVCAIGAVLNMLLMMAANLVGFVIGTDGLKFFLGELFGTIAGVKFAVGAVFCMFVGAQFMFEYREEEMRKGIFRRC